MTPVGPGARRSRSAGDRGRDRGRGGARHPRREPLDDLRLERGAQPRGRRLLRAALGRAAAGRAGGRAIRRRAGSGRGADGRLARPLRDQLHVLPEPGHVRPRRARRDPGRPAARLGDRRRWCSGRRSPSRRSSIVARPGVDDGLPGPGRHARDVRPARRPGADIAVPGDRGDVLVRGPGADGGVRDPGDRGGDGRRPAAARADVARGRGRPGGARGARLRRHALAAARRAAALGRVRRRDRRALPRRRTTRPTPSTTSSATRSRRRRGSGSRPSSPSCAARR